MAAGIAAIASMAMTIPAATVGLGSPCVRGRFNAVPQILGRILFREQMAGGVFESGSELRNL
jgi:hypothetical protein